MRSFSLFELEPFAPADFRRWATGGVLLAAMAYTAVALTLLLLQSSATLVPPWTSVIAAVVCWVAFGLVLRGKARVGAAIATLACWAEVHSAFLVTPAFPSVGLAVGPVLVMAATLLLGQRAGLSLTLLSIVITPWLLMRSPSFDTGAFSVESAYWLGVHAVVMFAAWTLVSISLSTLRRVVELARAQEAEVAAMIAAAPDGILILGDDDCVMHANAAAARLLGVPEAEQTREELATLLKRAGMQGEAAAALRLQDPMEAPLLWTFVRGGVPIGIEVTWRRIDERRRQLMLRDVSDRMRSEAARRDNQAQMAHSQRLEAIGQLAGGIAHDFNNLLMAISGSAELARDEQDAEMRQTLLDEVLAAQERGASLTRQLLAFARRDVARPTVLDLSALIAQRQRLLQPIVGDRVQLVLDLEPDCRVRIDATQMEQALLNMVANSRDAMPSGGRCTISVHRVRSVMGPGEVRLTIEDEGLGMDAATVARAFEPFFTTKARGHGTGLGLASVQGIILQSGGTVAIESTVGRGTKVLITLPYCDAPLEDPGALPRAREPRTGGGATILVVDDDDSTRTVVARILQRAGHRVILAPDGLQAIRVIMADPDIDMLVSDVTMPGLTGPELAEAVQSRLPGLPMLFISGYPRDVVTSESGLRGEHDLITKPFTARELTERVAERLAAARAR